MLHTTRTQLSVFSSHPSVKDLVKRNNYVSSLHNRKLQKKNDTNKIQLFQRWLHHAPMEKLHFVLVHMHKLKGATPASILLVQGQGRDTLQFPKNS